MNDTDIVAVMHQLLARRTAELEELKTLIASAEKMFGGGAAH
jgi:hypothetical protein